MKLRIICQWQDVGDAAHVKGAVAQIGYKTFEVEAPPELATWLTASTPYSSATIIGVEYEHLEAAR